MVELEKRNSDVDHDHDHPHDHDHGHSNHDYDRDYDHDQDQGPSSNSEVPVVDHHAPEKIKPEEGNGIDEEQRMALQMIEELLNRN